MVYIRPPFSDLPLLGSSFNHSTSHGQICPIILMTYDLWSVGTTAVTLVYERPPAYASCGAELDFRKGFTNQFANGIRETSSQTITLRIIVYKRES